MQDDPNKPKEDIKQVSQYLKLNVELLKSAHKDSMSHLQDWIKILFALFLTYISIIFLHKLVKINTKQCLDRLEKIK